MTRRGRTFGPDPWNRTPKNVEMFVHVQWCWSYPVGFLGECVISKWWFLSTSRSGWWLKKTPLKNIRLRQLGWSIPNISGKIRNGNQTTNQMLVYRRLHEWKTMENTVGMYLLIFPTVYRWRRGAIPSQQARCLSGIIIMDHQIDKSSQIVDPRRSSSQILWFWSSRALILDPN